MRQTPARVVGRLALLGLVWPTALHASAPVLFGSPQHYVCPGRPSAAAAADLNGDGKLDLIVAAKNAGSLAVFLGNGDGTLGIRTDVPTYSNPVALDVGDLDGNGTVDVVAASGETDFGTVTVHLGQGDGTLAPGVNYGAAGKMRFVRVGEFTGDTHPDVLTVTGHWDVYTETASRLCTFPGHGDGTLGVSDSVLTGGCALLAADVGDVSADGVADAIVTSTLSYPCGPGTNLVQAFLGGSGGGRFAFASQADLGIFDPPPAGVAVGDLGDGGAAEIVIATDSLVVWRVGAGPVMQRGPAVPFSHAPYPSGLLAIGDVDNDAIPDVVAADGSTDSLFAFRGVGNMALSATQALAVGHSPLALTLADLNGDDRPEAILCEAEGYVTVIRNTSGQTAVRPGERPGDETALPALALEIASSPSHAGGVTLHCRAPRPGHASVVILTAAGKEVWRHEQEVDTAGAFRLRWDGTLSHAHRAPTGTYVCELRMGAERVAHRFVWMH